MGPIPHSVESFDRLLTEVREGVSALRAHDPGNRWFASIELQLEDVREATRGGRCPSASDLARYNFGLLADRAVDDIDRPLAQKLYSLAYFLAHWPKPNPH